MPCSSASFYSRVDWTWQSSNAPADTNLDPQDAAYQGAYSLVNLRLGLKAPSGFDVSVGANNVFNTTYSQADYVSNCRANDPAYQRYLGRPREYGLTIKKSF